MDTQFFTYKSITITWFMFFTFISIIIGYIISLWNSKESNIKRKKIEDIYLTLVISGFIGARLTYVILNARLFKDNILSVFKLTHYNLNFAGGILIGLLSLYIISRIYKYSFSELFKIYIIPYYLSLSVGVWYLYYDRLSLINLSNNMSLIYVLILSLIFLIGIILESLCERFKNNNISYLILVFITIVYYLTKYVML